MVSILDQEAGEEVVTTSKITINDLRKATSKGEAVATGNNSSEDDSDGGAGAAHVDYEDDDPLRGPSPSSPGSGAPISPATSSRSAFRRDAVKSRDSQARMITAAANRAESNANVLADMLDQKLEERALRPRKSFSASMSMPMEAMKRGGGQTGMKIKGWSPRKSPRYLFFILHIYPRHRTAAQT